MKGMGSHQSAAMMKDEWLTPPHIFEGLGVPQEKAQTIIKDIKKGDFIALNKLLKIEELK